MSCGVGHRHGLDPVATALIRPLAWEPPYAAGAPLKRQKKKRKKEPNKKKHVICFQL